MKNLVQSNISAIVLFFVLSGSLSTLAQTNNNWLKLDTIKEAVSKAKKCHTEFISASLFKTKSMF